MSHATTDARRIGIDNVFLTNTPKGRSHPRGLGWISYIIAHRRSTGRIFVITLRGRVKRDVDRQLRALMRKPGVYLKKRSEA